MKKIISVLLLIVLIFSLSACEKNYDLFSNESPSSKKTSKTFSIKTIEINIDNWQDYFEFKEETKVEKNAFGETQNIFLDYSFVHKKNIDYAGSDVALEFSYIEECRYMERDLQNDTLIWGDFVIRPPYDMSEYSYKKEKSKVSGYGHLFMGGDLSLRNENYGYRYTNFNMIRIQGNIYIKVYN